MDRISIPNYRFGIKNIIGKENQYPDDWINKKFERIQVS